jgi:predicted phage terminase large subunit-like protein
MTNPKVLKSYHRLLRSDFSAFTKKVYFTVSPNSPYLHNWHIDLIAEYLLACQQRKIKRLIINIPPRYLKSISVNVAWPCWLLGNNPSEKIISASYSQTLSLKHSIDSRLVIESDWYKQTFGDLKLTDDQNTKSKFVTEKRGSRFATSVGGTLTGEGGNFLILDDPHNALEAQSEKERQTAIEWYKQVFASRLDDKKNGVIVLVMQRLQQEDLTGHLIKNDWVHLKIPAINRTKKDLVFNFPISGRQVIMKPNDVLHESRETLEQLLQTESELGSYAFAGQYLQEPVPVEGGLVKRAWIKWHSKKPVEYWDEIIQSWDTAIKEGQFNDYSVCTIWGRKGEHWFIIEIIREKMGYPTLKKSVINTAQKYSEKLTHILVEDKASGQTIVQDLITETRLPIIAIQPKGDKVARLSMVSGDIEAGRLSLQTDGENTDEAINELMGFPTVSHDDIVDSITQFLIWVKNRNKIRVLEI